MAAQEFTIQEYPDHGWVIMVDGRVIPLLYEDRTEAAKMALMLLDKYAEDERASGDTAQYGMLASA